MLECTDRIRYSLFVRWDMLPAGWSPCCGRRRVPVAAFDEPNLGRTDAWPGNSTEHSAVRKLLCDTLADFESSAWLLFRVKADGREA